MTAPRHLWSGDWRRESADAARDLAERRAQDDELTVAEPATPAETPAPTLPKPAATAAARPKPAAPAPAPHPRVEQPAARTQPTTRTPPAARTQPVPRPAPARRARPVQRERRSMSGPRTVVVILAALVSAGIAYAVVSTVVGSGNDSSTPPVSQVSPPSHAAPAASGPAWLGADTESVGVAGGGSTSGSGNTGGLSSGSGNTGGFSSGAGAVVTNVAPGSPADAAGLEPGDVITQINGRTVSSPNDITSVLAGMHAGQSVEIQYQRGPFADAAQVTLAARPAGTP